jgi:Do/DeqQ family serine protease
MTNYHVIKEADEVQVSLADGRSFEAKILGVDADLDIAILEVDGKDLVDVTIADSDVLEVGDFVVAIGNPFGLGQTVTTGVVSALGRTGLGIEGYENFIQTDASINPGNSGGALVNLAGELVGINTAIIAPSGGNVGIGFAIPSNMAKASMEQILEHGEVKRGQIGIGIQDITPDLRKAFALENGQGGVLITNVVKGSPAEDAGLEAGDIVIEVDGQPTRSTGQLRSQIGMRTVGDYTKLTIIRDGEIERRKVKVGKPETFAQLDGTLHDLLEGVQLEEEPNGKGILVAHIAPNSSAAYSGLRPGDIIVAVNKRRVYDIPSLSQALSLSKSSILMQVNRRGGSLFIVIR